LFFFSFLYRFGKRSGSATSYSNHPSFVALVDHDSIPSFSSESDMLNENIPNGILFPYPYWTSNFIYLFLANDQRIDVDNIYTFGYSDQKRRRRR
jgi:hypothetical protein